MQQEVWRQSEMGQKEGLRLRGSTIAGAIVIDLTDFSPISALQHTLLVR